MSRRTDADIENIIGAATNCFGINEVKEQQLSALKNYLKGYDVFCILPTGYGKSLIFQTFHLCYDKLHGYDDTISLVIFPLKSLIEDQIAKLKEKGISALYINETTSAQEIIDGKYALLFSTPETLLSSTSSGRKILLTDSVRKRIRGIFVDECHVVTKW